MTEPKELCIAYELWHVDLARAHAARDATIVCLNFLVERELIKKGVPCVSLRDVVIPEHTEEEWWLLAQEVAYKWYHLPAMKFFEYNNIRIAEVVEPILEEYLSKLFYYVRIYAALKKTYPGAHVSIPALIIEDRSTDECLVSFERRIATDAARMAGLRFDVLGKLVASPAPPFFQTVRKSLLIRIYNSIISFVPRRSLKIYAGEYWSHIAPIIEKMDDVELVLMESGALKQISWRQLLAHRIRVRHPRDEIHGEERKEAVRISAKFAKQWETAKKEVAEYFASAREGLDWSPVLQACEYLVASYALRVIADIGAVRRIMEEEKPDVVLQSASVAGRHHYFFIMARVAAQLAIPSIELQHGINSFDLRTAYSRFETDYLATYGADTNAWHERMGRPRERLIAIGSPRFDGYVNARAGALEKGKQMLAQLGLDHTRPVLLVAVPFSDVNTSAFDSYQCAEFFEAVHAAQSTIPGMQVLFKFRRHECDGAMREYIQELFPADSAIAGSEELFPLVCASDAVVCGNSTVIYETMLAQKPLVLYPWKSFDTCNAQVYAPAAPLTHTAGELVDVLARIFADSLYREELLARQKHFLERCSFDGKSSERMGAFIRRLSRKQHGPTSN